MLLIIGLWMHYRTYYASWGLVCFILGLGCLEVAAYIVTLMDGLLFRGWML